MSLRSICLFAYLLMRLFPLFLFAFLFLCHCKNKPSNGSTPEETASLPANTDLPADFVAFYQQFHQDSAYQMAHIAWPLQGDRSEQIDSTHYQPQSTTWMPDNWRMMRLNFSPKDYFIETEMLGDIMVIEKIRARSVSYGLERRFAKQPNGEWELIFYSDVQERGK